MSQRDNIESARSAGIASARKFVDAASTTRVDDGRSRVTKAT
jgi:hypothetical protein